MEELRQITDENYLPIKGDNVVLNNRQGILLDSEFIQIQWLDNDEVENWQGGWFSFINSGGYLLTI